MTYAVKPRHSETIYYDVCDPITGQKETRSYQVVDRWGIVDEQDQVVELDRKFLTHWHRESLERKAMELNGITKEERMQYVVVKKTGEGQSVPVAGPYDEVDANFQRKRLGEQHPEAEFEVMPIPSDIQVS